MASHSTILVEDVVVAVVSRAPLVPLLSALCGLLAGCGAKNADSTPAARPVAEAGVLVDTATVDVPGSYLGQVYVERDVAVAARAAGVVDSLYENLGARIEANAPLAAIDRQAQEIARDRAQVQFDRARAALNRSREFAKAGGVTPADSEEVATVFREAELALRHAQRDVELTRVNAPFAGVVTARYVKPRQLVAVGDTLFRVAALAPQLVRVRVGDAAAKSVIVGERVTVVSADHASNADARVVLASPSFDAASGTREVILQLSSPKFLVGESVTALIGHERRRVIVAPRSAIAPDGYALVIEGARTTLRPVTRGADLTGDRVEIVSGLVAGDRLAPPRR